MKFYVGLGYFKFQRNNTYMLKGSKYIVLKKMCFKPRLKSHHKQVRMDWARKYMLFGYMWHTVIFCDEKNKIWMVLLVVIVTFMTPRKSYALSSKVEKRYTFDDLETIGFNNRSWKTFLHEKQNSTKYQEALDARTTSISTWWHISGFWVEIYALLCINPQLKKQEPLAFLPKW